MWRSEWHTQEQQTFFVCNNYTKSQRLITCTQMQPQQKYNHVRSKEFCFKVIHYQRVENKKIISHIVWVRIDLDV